VEASQAGLGLNPTFNTLLIFLVLAFYLQINTTSNREEQYLTDRDFEVSYPLSDAYISFL
jgi:hypothetical protein